MRENEGNGFPANEGKTMRENVGKLGKIVGKLRKMMEN